LLSIKIGTQQQDIRLNGGRKQGRACPKNGPKTHNKKKKEEKNRKDDIIEIDFRT
jgi:hypothetical protein